MVRREGRRGQGGEEKVSKNFDEPPDVCSVFLDMKTRALTVIAGSLVLLGSARAALFPQGIVDHSLCCGTGPMAAAARAGAANQVAVSDASAAASVLPIAALPTAPGAAVKPAEAMEQRLANPEVENGYLKLGFDRLAGFKFLPPVFDPLADAKAVPPTGEEQIPATVKGWSGHKALVTGFMLPTKLEKGKCTEFILMANQMACCYGGTPNMNDWVIVRMPQGVAAVMDVPVSFYGTLKVGATFENGYMTGIYELAAEKMAEIKG